MQAHQNRLLSNLDGVRAIACLLVVAAHSPLSMVFPALGAVGVAVFFTLSGFLMGYLYGHQSWNKCAVLRYGIARFSRIAPIYWVAITLCVLLTAVSNEFEPRITGEIKIALHYVFLGSVSVYWSIPPEVQYYVLFVLIWGALFFWRTLPIAMLILITIIIIVMTYQSSWPGITVMHKIHFFLFGTIAGLAPRMKEYGIKARPWWRLGVLLLIFAPLLSIQVPDVIYDNIEYAAFYSLIIYVISHDCDFTNFILGRSWLRSIGKASFSIYLLHMVVLLNVGRLLNIDINKPSIGVIGVVVLSIILPMIVSRLVEFRLSLVLKQALERFFLARRLS